MSSPLVGTASAAPSIDRVRYTHDAMIDFILANPAASQGEIAKVFGYTQAWVSRVINSDAFNKRLAERKDDLIDPTIIMTAEERLRTLMVTATNRIQEKLEQPLAQAGVVDTALKALDLSTRALGYGARPQNVALQQNFVVAMPAKVQSPEAWAQMGKDAGAGAGARPMQMVEEVKAA